MADRKPVLLRSSPAGIAAIVLVSASVVLAVITVVVSVKRDLTALEGSLLQAFILLASLAGSYLFGTLAAAASGRERTKLHARSALRRVLSLFQGLSRLAEQVQTAKDAEDPNEQVTAYDVLATSIEHQILTVDDVLEDWRDIVPEEVEELQGRIRRGEPLLRSEE